MGRFYWNKRNEDGLLKAVNYFNQAIARDPTYARAYAGLADAYLVLGGGYLPDLEAYGKAREAAIKAIELDDSLPEAYASLAYEEFVHERDWHRAEENFRKSIALDPEYPIAHAWYALYLVAMSRGDEAVEEIDRALELDPLSLPVAYNAGSIHFLTGRRDEGLALARKALEIDPNCAPAHGGLASDYLNMGDFQKAIDEFRRAQELRAGYSPYAVEIAQVYAVEGKKNEAYRALARLLSDPGWGKVAPYTFAVTYAALGQKNEAFKWLQKSVDDHSCSVMEVNTDHGLDPLRSDPRFTKIRLQFGLQG